MKKIAARLRANKALAMVLVALCFGVVLGYGLSNDDSGAKPITPDEQAPPATAQNSDHTNDHSGQLQGSLTEWDQPKNTIYVCPMNCVAPMAKPGRCPVCGMDLVAMDAHDHQQMDHPTRITLSEQDKKFAGIQVAPVEEKFVAANIKLYGKIEYDPVEMYKVTAFTPGVVDNIYVKRAGMMVRRGDPLFDLHSSDLFFLEQEFFDTIKEFPFALNLQQGRGHGKERLGRWAKVLLPDKPGKDVQVSAEDKKAATEALNRARHKLRLFGLGKKDIDRIMVRGKPSGIATITTPLTGVVLEQNAFRGTYVNTGDVIFTIANPRTLWARLDAYATDFPWIRLGQTAEFEIDAYPGMTFTGRVVFLDPEFNPDSGVFKVGVLYNDKKGLLKPNMLVRAVIHAKLTSGGESVTEVSTRGMLGTQQMKRIDTPPLVIPDTAPLITGERAVVYVQVPGKPGTYIGREVKLGPRGKGYYMVKEGLHKGEMVVVNGNFKIDSAVQILAKSSMMTHNSSDLPVDHYQHVETPAMQMEMKSKTKEQKKGPQYPFHRGQAISEPANKEASKQVAHAGHMKSELPKDKGITSKNPRMFPPKTITKDLKCPVCGMYPAKYVKWQSQVIFKDGVFRAFDGAKDMFKYLLEMGKYETNYTQDDVSVIYVKDFFNRKWINAKHAHYVAGGKISGPMGKDLIPFSDHMKALKVAEAGGGHTVQYSQINLKMIQSSVAMQKGEMHKHD